MICIEHWKPLPCPQCLIHQLEVNLDAAERRIAELEGLSIQVTVADFIKAIQKHPDATGIPSIWAEWPARSKAAELEGAKDG